MAEDVIGFPGETSLHIDPEQIVRELEPEGMDEIIVIYQKDDRLHMCCSSPRMEEVLFDIERIKHSILSEVT